MINFIIITFIKEIVHIILLRTCIHSQTYICKYKLFLNLIIIIKCYKKFQIFLFSKFSILHSILVIKYDVSLSLFLKNIKYVSF